MELLSDDFLLMKTLNGRNKSYTMPLEEIIGKRVSNIKVGLLKDEVNYCNSISLFLEEEEQLLININADTDEVIISHNKNEKVVKDVAAINVYEALVGKQVVSYWTASNHLGYNDFFAIGLDEFKPTLVISSLGSALHIAVCNYQ